jgi:hypothetical protein
LRRARPARCSRRYACLTLLRRVEASLGGHHAHLRWPPVPAVAALQDLRLQQIHQLSNHFHGLGLSCELEAGTRDGQGLQNLLERTLHSSKQPWESKLLKSMSAQALRCSRHALAASHKRVRVSSLVCSSESLASSSPTVNIRTPCDWLAQSEP